MRLTPSLLKGYLTTLSLNSYPNIKDKILGYEFFPFAHLVNIDGAG
ncbi:hypothetical protein AVDCRST_MAG92-2063 [uncultured Coleofasciculus sp.]|uniref:Uncharacterized protein n=1 Tax=uncultured Coleofasciculus sp. TaxID=1267456 RepID=A0A6J4IJG5_9CYAN|nr:hypothetical protein AVDCRST_MAG92-2063 [uncultured Coleofasciculus sp.]